MVDFPKNPSFCFCFYVFYDCRGWYTGDIYCSKPPTKCLWQLFKLCSSFLDEFWRKSLEIWLQRQNIWAKTVIFAFSQLEKATEPLGDRQPIDICFSKVDILYRDSKHVQLEHIKSSKQSNKTSLRYDSKRSLWCLFLVRKIA